MSEIKVNSIKGVGATSAAISINNTDGTCAVNNTQRQGKNLVINGGMLCSQRGSSFSQVANNDITLDRFGLLHPYSTNFDVSQSTDSPDGFSKSYKLDINAVDSSIGSGQYVAIRHKIEAQNLQQLAFGTSAAKSISLSFYVKSNKTGTFAVNIQQTDNSSKQVSAPYTISSANTWERKTFTFAGDTSGVINDDNGIGLTIIWWLSAGSTYSSGTSRSTFTAYADADAAAGCNVNILDSTSNNFYLTGVQLETSDAASDFEHRSFAQEIALCGRYYQNLIAANTKALGIGMAYNGATFQIVLEYPLGKMRTAPSIDAVTGADYWQIEGGGLSPEKHIDGSFVAEHSTDTQMSFYGVPDSNFTDLGASHYLRSDNSACRFSFSAEL